MISTTESYKTKIKESLREFRGKVEFYFDGLENEPTVFYSADYLVSINLLEEYSIQDHNPLGLISSNEAIITLASPNHIFNPVNAASPYYGKMLPNLTVKPYIGIVLEEETIEEPEAVEFIPLGIFYTGDWNLSGQELYTTIRCTDGISRNFDKRMMQVPIQENTSAKDLFEKLFEIIEIPPQAYHIDPSLDTTIKYGWFQGDKLRGVIQNIAHNSCCSVFINRYGDVSVKNNYTIGDPVLVLTDYDQVISSQAPQKYSKVYSSINVEHGKPFVDSSTEIFNVFDIEVGLDGIDFKRAKFNTGPVAVVDQILITGGENLSVDYFSFGAWDFTLRILNPGAVATVTIKIYGSCIERTDDVASMINDDLTDKIGDKPLTLNPYLIQDESNAIGYGDLLLGLVSDPLGHVTAEIIGDPSLEIGDVITIQNPSHAMETIDVMITKLQLNYSGGLSCNIEGVSRASRIKYDWVSVSPGMYNLVTREVN